MATLNFPETPSEFKSTLVTFRSTYYLSASSIDRLKSVNSSDLHDFMMQYITEDLVRCKAVDFTSNGLIPTTALFGIQDLKTLSSLQYLLAIYLLYINKENQSKVTYDEEVDFLNYTAELRDSTLSIDINKKYTLMSPEVLKSRLEYLSKESNEKGTFLIDLGIDVPVKILWA